MMARQRRRFCSHENGRFGNFGLDIEPVAVVACRAGVGTGIYRAVAGCCSGGVATGNAGYCPTFRAADRLERRAVRVETAAAEAGRVLRGDYAAAMWSHREEGNLTQATMD